SIRLVPQVETQSRRIPGNLFAQLRDTGPDLTVGRKVERVEGLDTWIAHETAQADCLDLPQISRGAEPGDVQPRVAHTPQLLRIGRRAAPGHDRKVLRIGRLRMAAGLRPCQWRKQNSE